MCIVPLLFIKCTSYPDDARFVIVFHYILPVNMLTRIFQTKPIFVFANGHTHTSYDLCAVGDLTGLIMQSYILESVTEKEAIRIMSSALLSYVVL